MGRLPHGPADIRGGIWGEERQKEEAGQRQRCRPKPHPCPFSRVPILAGVRQAGTPYSAELLQSALIDAFGCRTFCFFVCVYLGPVGDKRRKNRLQPSARFFSRAKYFPIVSGCVQSQDLVSCSGTTTQLSILTDRVQVRLHKVLSGLNVMEQPKVLGPDRPSR